MTHRPASILLAAALAVPAPALAGPFPGTCASTDAPFPYNVTACHSSHCTLQGSDELHCQSYALGAGTSNTSAWVV